MNLIWVDMEMTGLDPTMTKSSEVAVVVTDMQLNVLAEGPVLRFTNPMKSWTKWMLGIKARMAVPAIDRVKASTVTEEQASKA